MEIRALKAERDLLLFSLVFSIGSIPNVSNFEVFSNNLSLLISLIIFLLTLFPSAYMYPASPVTDRKNNVAYMCSLPKP